LGTWATTGQGRGCGDFSLFHPLFYRRLIEGGRFPFLNGNRTGGARRQTVPKAVAVTIRDQFCFAVHHLQGPFVTGIDAKAATIAFGFVNLDDLPFHLFHLFLQENSCPVGFIVI
jgi:hypothetical protein